MLGNSHFVSTAGPARGDVREARAGNLRVLLNYTPENHVVIAAQEKAVAASA